MKVPPALERELEDLQRFGVLCSAVSDQVILAAEVRGVPVVLYLDRDTYPARSPRLEIARDWLGSRHGRPIRGLESQRHWNRTLGIGALLRELEQRFIEDPPARGARRGLGRIRSAWRSMQGGLARLVRRLLGRRAAAEPALAMPDAIRARYQEIIGEKTSRVTRYKEVLAQLMSHWQRKTAELEKLGREIQALEQSEQARLAAAERLVGQLKTAGKTIEQIRSDALYRRGRAAYEEVAADLAQKQQRFAVLEADAESHLAKIRQHEARVEALVRELAELKDESEEVAVDAATVQLEQEIADLRAGISRAGADRELRALLRQFRKARAAVRVTREAAGLDDPTQDAEYLQVARRVDAAGRFERSVGLAVAGDPVDEGPARE